MEIPNIPGQTPTPKPEEITPPEAPVQPEKEVVPAPPVVKDDKEKEDSMPKKIEKVNTPSAKKKSVLPSSILTKEAKTQLVLEKKESLRQSQLLKKAAFLFLLLSLGWFFWLQMNLSETNTFLALVGVKQNMGQEIKELKKAKTKVTLEEKKLKKDIDKLDRQLTDKIYTLHAEEVQNVRSEQIQWFDEIDEDGNVIFGMAGAIPRMQEYFNSRSYTDPDQILSGKHSDIEIENLQISRDGISFTVVASQILGKVFFLNIEFIEMVNSFPFLKNGVITQFARQKNTDEDDSMRFSVRLDRQLANEEDPYDARFEEYTSWLNATTPTPSK